jgi:hypothetical protein
MATPKRLHRFENRADRLAPRVSISHGTLYARFAMGGISLWSGVRICGQETTAR